MVEEDECGDTERREREIKRIKATNDKECVILSEMEGAGLLCWRP